MNSDSTVSVTGSRCVIANSLVHRVLEYDGDVWRTTTFARADSSDANRIVSDEFLILLLDGRRLTASDYRVDAPPRTVEDGTEAIVEITFIPRTPSPDAPQRVTVRYTLDHKPYLRKTLSLEMAPESAVDRLEVERFRTPLVCDLGGLGEPVFIGDAWFAGLEYPGSHTEHADGVVTLAHYPGSAKADDGGRWSIQSKTAVVGTGAPGDPVDIAFHDYIESVRLSATKHLLINTWMSTVRNPESTDALLEFFDRYTENLRPYGVGIDSLQPDLMGFEPKTLSRPRQDIFPDGYKPLSDGLKARGSRLSLWLCTARRRSCSMKCFSHRAKQHFAPDFQPPSRHACVPQPVVSAAGPWAKALEARGNGGTSPRRRELGSELEECTPDEDRDYETCQK